MFRNKKIIIIAVILFFSILVAAILLTSRKENINTPVSTVTVNEEKTKVNGILSEEERLAIANEIKDAFENKTDKKILKVNGEEISEKEIAFIDYQKNNELVNKGEEIDAINETIKQYVILQDAEKNDIKLTESEEKNIKTRIEKSIQNSTEKEIDALLDSFNMNQEEFMEFYVDREKKLEIISKWTVQMMTKIHNEEIIIEDETFKKKYDEYLRSNKKTSLMELLNLYEDYLKEQAEVEYIN